MLPFDGSVDAAPVCVSVASGWYLGLDFVLIAALLATGVCGAQWIGTAVAGEAPRGSCLRVALRIGQVLALTYAAADVTENVLLLAAPNAAAGLRAASTAKLALFLLALIVFVAAAFCRGRQAAAVPPPDPPGDVENLQADLADSRLYRKKFGGGRPADWVRGSRSRRHDLDEAQGRAFLDRSCDVTMRGGTTSGVIYPLAICALAQKYVFRNVGGASAGAIAASATAAAELGRFTDPAEPTASPPGERVVPGFAGLAQLVGWLIAPRDETEPRTSVPNEHLTHQIRANDDAVPGQRAGTGRGQAAG